MVTVTKLPKKFQFLLELEFPTIDLLFPRIGFIGGRIGFSKQEVFRWLLVKKVTNWDFRTIAELSGISHPTLVRRNQQFERNRIYQQFFHSLVKKARKQGLIQGRKVAIDSSFVKTYSQKEEYGCGGYNGYKKAYGFKLHALIDAETQFPLALITGDGVSHDSKFALSLLKRVRRYLKNEGYVLADKAYDDTDIVAWIVQQLKSKAGIPMRKKSRLAKGKKHRYGNLLNWRLKAVGRTFKKSILKLRTEIERFFSSLKRAFHLGKELTRGGEAFRRNACLSLISYCVKRFYTEGTTCF